MMERRDILLTKGETQLKGLECPICRARADGYTGLSKDLQDPARVPKPGNISICFNCGGLMVYTESFASYRPLSLRVATREEEESFRSHPYWGPIYRILQELRVRERFFRIG